MNLNIRSERKTNDYQAMMLFPDVQRKVHEELDAVVGEDRYPTMDDFQSLPYVRQTVKEALRCKLRGRKLFVAIANS